MFERTRVKWNWKLDIAINLKCISFYFLTFFFFSDSIQTKSADVGLDYIQQLLLFVCHNQKKEVAGILRNNADLFRDFFLSDDSKLVNWFSFRFSGKNEHGGLALEQWLFYYRDVVWDKLRWTGKRSVPPVIAIQKKNMLLELDLVFCLRKMSALYGKEGKEQMRKDREENREEGEMEEKEEKEEDGEEEYKKKRVTKSIYQREIEVEDFWESDFFKESLDSGDFLQMDYKFFADHLLKMLQEGGKDRERVVDLIKLYIQSQPFSVLCQKLLLLLDNEQILSFLYHLTSNTTSSSSLTLSNLTTNYINQVILCECKWASLDSVLFYNAITNFGRQFIRLITEDEGTISCFAFIFLNLNICNQPILSHSTNLCCKNIL